VARVSVQQLVPVLGDLVRNRAMARAAVREAFEAGAEVVVLPELVTSGYAFASAAEAADAAITVDHPILQDWAAEAARADGVVVAGFCERGDDGLHNSAALVDAGGLRAVYRKLHLWDAEKTLFTAGSAPPPVVDTRVGRVAVLICYDLEFPELTRAVALDGAQLLAVPTNWPLMSRPAGERPAEVVIAMATARVNRMAIACADRLGAERGVAWTGGSTIVGIDGWVAAESRGPGLLVAEVDLAGALDKRLADRADAFGDRRPDVYLGAPPPSFR
jgi:5-aminopentanamidase